MMPECRVWAWHTHIAVKACDTTLDDAKLNWPNRGAVPIDNTCIVVTALCNHPKAYASDLGDDRSHYL